MRNHAYVVCCWTALQAVLLLTASQITAGAQNISAAQAQSILTGCVQAPDTALTVPPITSADRNGHTDYLFYGNQGGNYSIDSLTGDKTISYAGLSAADGIAQTPSVHLSASALLQIATSYVSQHFPNYVSGMFQINAPLIDVSSDGDEYYADFKSIAASGALLPTHAYVIVEEDTGKVKSYEESIISLTISTTPAISQSQAVQIGQNWIAQNVSTDPVAGQFQTDLGRSSPIRFYVNVDPLLNQTLLYEICYTTTALDIDAQSGAVVGQDFYAGATTKIVGSASRSPQDQEIVYTMRLASSGDRLNYAAIGTQGQTYLWSGYLKSVGVRMERKSSTVTLHNGAKQVILQLSATAKPDNKVAWQRKGGIYLPLAALQSLTPSFVKYANMQEVIVKLPLSKQAIKGGK